MLPAVLLIPLAIATHVLQPGTAAPPQPSAELRRANDLYATENWAGAAAAYEAVIRQTPSNSSTSGSASGTSSLPTRPRIRRPPRA